MKLFLRKTSCVDAVQYDGTARGALAVAAALPGLVGVSLDHPATLVVVSRGRLKPVPAGSWIVILWRCDGVEIWSDEEFRRDHTPASPAPAVIALPAPEQSA